MANIILKLSQRILKILFTISAALMLCACAEYKSRLTARSGDYDEIKLTKKLEYPNGVKGFALGDKYVVPEVASKSDTGTPSIEPPEYLKK